jgi:hypothetical protein
MLKVEFISLFWKMKMRFIKQNLLLGDGVFFMNNNSHPPHSPSADGGNLNLTSNYVFSRLLISHSLICHKVHQKTTK